MRRAGGGGCDVRRRQARAAARPTTGRGKYVDRGPASQVLRPLRLAGQANAARRVLDRIASSPNDVTDAIRSTSASRCDRRPEQVLLADRCAARHAHGLDSELSARNLVNGPTAQLGDLPARRAVRAPDRRAIVRRRAEHPFERTGETVDDQAGDRHPRFGDGHPAKRVFRRCACGQHEPAPSRPPAAALGCCAGGGWPSSTSTRSGTDRQALLPQQARSAARRAADLRVRQAADAAGPHPQAGAPGAREVQENPRRVGEIPCGLVVAEWWLPGRGCARRGASAPGLPGGRHESQAEVAPPEAAPARGSVVDRRLGALLARSSRSTSPCSAQPLLDRLGRERVQLRADNASLSARLSSASAAARIETQARGKLGLVPADPGTTSYVQLAK